MHRLFYALSRRERFFVGVSALLLMAQVWIDLKIPDIMSQLTRLVQGTGGSVSEILATGAPMVWLSLASLGVSLTIGYLAAKVSAGLAHHLRGALYDKILQYSMEEIHAISPASLINRCTNDVTQIQMVIAMMLQMFLRAPLMAVWALVKIFGKQWQWTAATGAAVAILVLLIVMIMVVALPRFRRIQGLTDDINRVAQEELTGIRVLRAFGAEEFHRRKFLDANDALTKNNLTAQRMMALIFPGMNFINAMLTLAVYRIGANLINTAALPFRIGIFADMVVFSSYAMQIIMSFMLLNMIFILLPRAQVAAQRVYEVLDLPLALSEGTVEEASRGGSVVFDHVSFTYPGARQPSLQDISFSVSPGETLAIIGPTGSGKSTLLHLLMRFREVSQGRILVDGVDVRNFSFHALRNRLGFVPQSSFLFSGSIEDTVAYGQQNLSPAAVTRALSIAQGDFVEELPEKLKSPVTQGGKNFSGGQRQRLSIARAIAKSPEILLFDDSFSALDYGTDRALRQALNTLSGVTKIIVAQRVASIQQADHILVMDRGRIVGEGRHEDLLKTCSIYQEIAHSQLTKEELAYA